MSPIAGLSAAKDQLERSGLFSELFTLFARAKHANFGIDPKSLSESATQRATAAGRSIVPS